MVAAAEHYGAAQAPDGGWPATFLVIAYRMRDTLPAAVAGAIAQTVPCEIIVSDDSSGDDAFALVRPMLQGLSLIHI